MNLDPFPVGAPVLYTRSTGETVRGRYVGINNDGTYRCEYEVDGEWRYHYMVRPEKVAPVEPTGLQALQAFQDWYAFLGGG